MFRNISDILKKMLCQRSDYSDGSKTNGSSFQPQGTLWKIVFRRFTIRFVFTERKSKANYRSFQQWNGYLWKNFLYSLNDCFYHYFLFLHHCSFCQCCYDNFRSFQLNDPYTNLFEEAKQLLFSYYQCMAKDCNHHIIAACRFIENHLSENLSLERVAAQVFVNRCYLCQLFKENMQESFSAYITRKRLEQAQTLLKTSHFSIDKIAEQCGFSSAGYFSTVFRKYYGQSPRAYRKTL